MWKKHGDLLVSFYQNQDRPNHGSPASQLRAFPSALLTRSTATLALHVVFNQEIFTVSQNDSYGPNDPLKITKKRNINGLTFLTERNIPSDYGYQTSKS